MNTTRLLIGFVLLVGAPAAADVGVFTGSGQTLRQITTESVALDSFDVTIIPGRGPLLFDGSVPGLDVAEFRCEFVLRNLTENPCSLQVGFPVDAPGADTVPWRRNEVSKFDWVGAYGFLARDADTTYHVKFDWQSIKRDQDGKRFDVLGLFKQAVFVWEMAFGANETKTLKVQYRIPISMTAAITSKRGLGADFVATARPWLDVLGVSILEFTLYTTDTGSSWAGKVQSASFTIMTDEFERYLNHRPLFEDSESTVTSDTPDRDSVVAAWSRPGWWSREIKPEGFHPVRGGIQKVVEDFEPTEPIEIRYFLTFLPSSAPGVDAWMDGFIDEVRAGRMMADELPLLKQVILATYGKVPEDDAVKKFAEDQLWYKPRENFDISDLGDEQRAILRRIDERIAAFNDAK